MSFMNSFASLASSLGTKISSTISEANASFESQQAQYLKERKEKDGGDFAETPAEALIVSVPSVVLPPQLGQQLSSKASSMFLSLKESIGDVVNGPPAKTDVLFEAGSGAGGGGGGGDAAVEDAVADTAAAPGERLPDEQTKDPLANLFRGWSLGSVGSGLTAAVSTVIAAAPAAGRGGSGSASPKRGDLDDAANDPWYGVPDAHSLREQIMQLSKDMRNFTTAPPEGTDFVFQLSEYHKTALRLLKVDPDLQKMRFELVPKRIKDDEFWRNYFYRVRMLQQQAMLSAAISPSSVMSAMPESLPVDGDATPTQTAPRAAAGQDAAHKSRSASASASASSICISINRDSGGRWTGVVADQTAGIAGAAGAVDERQGRGAAADKGKKSSGAGGFASDLDSLGDDEELAEHGYASDWETQLQAELGDLDSDDDATANEL
ncbi:hypothetical protein BC831DRAFT_510940 [Entophlyctis helioformis]|nr:hypothetical protein BC831DRAFT_510940 [Entophlyctis helioformis]